MEFGLREWMILIGGLLILVVIADGVRRVLADRRNVIRMGKSRSHQSELPDEDIVNPELPFGGARSVPRSEYDPTAAKARIAAAGARTTVPGKPVRRPLDQLSEQAPAEQPGQGTAPMEERSGSQHPSDSSPDQVIAEKATGVDAADQSPARPELPPEPGFDFTPDPAIYADGEDIDPLIDLAAERLLG